MRPFLAGLFLMLLGFGAALPARAAGPTAEEREVAEAVKSPSVTVVHLWAPWCPNCTSELRGGGWGRFLAANPDVKVVFVTVWRGDGADGRELLGRSGVGAQPNFQLVTHPNASRQKADKMTRFLDQPVTWIPTTWIYRGGTLRYALNYGELRFEMLQQLVHDAADRWQH